MENDIRQLLNKVKNGECSVEDAVLRLRMKPFEDLGYAKVDHHRRIRQGMAEVIYGAGKSADQIAGIAQSMLDEGERSILITRLDEEKAAVLKDIFGHGIEYDSVSRTGLIGGYPPATGNGRILIITGGTSDIPVAREAEVTARAMGNEVIMIIDAGVAGLHRLLSYTEEIMSASVIIAVAGMEGALASVIGGLADCPVVAVPTSVGYGAAFEGMAALLSMLNSCSGGVATVNIDNGFGAGYFASMINHSGGK